MQFYFCRFLATNICDGGIDHGLNDRFTHRVVGVDQSDRNVTLNEQFIID